MGAEQPTESPNVLEAEAIGDLADPLVGELRRGNFLKGLVEPLLPDVTSNPADRLEQKTLKRGDLVLTSDGRTKPVTWPGRQTVSTSFADPLRVLPIRIKAGALADNVPCARPAAIARSCRPRRRRTHPGRRIGQRHLNRARDQDSTHLHLLSCRTRRPFADPRREHPGRDLRRQRRSHELRQLGRT